MRPTTPCRPGWTAWQTSGRRRVTGYPYYSCEAHRLRPVSCAGQRIPSPASVPAIDEISHKHRGLRNPLEAERFQVSVEGERRVDAFPLHQNLGCAIRVRNARRSISPERRVGLPLDLFGDMQHSQGRGDPAQAEDGHSDASTRLVEEKRDGLVDHVVRRVKETERVAGFRD